MQMQMQIQQLQLQAGWQAGRLAELPLPPPTVPAKQFVVVVVIAAAAAAALGRQVKCVLKQTASWAARKQLMC